jgi:D-serine deaminase-like pyridoxal phosphate-dependent protein
VSDILVTNEIVDPSKLSRLAELARSARIGVLADDIDVVAAIGDAARAAKAAVDVYVEIDVGAHRCGIASVADAVTLARAIDHTSGLRFGGLQAYHGSAQHLRSPDDRRAAIATATDIAKAARDAIVAAGVACPTVTGAGTGTWLLERQTGVYNELQPGSYVFMDADYGRNTLAPDELAFEQSLFVVTMVMSAAVAGHIVVDAGLKAFAFDSGPPLVESAAGLAYVKASDEHGVVAVAHDTARPALGERLWMIPGHCDPTVNLYDWLIGVRAGRVETLWPVSARGALS